MTFRHLLTHTSGMPDFTVTDLVGPIMEEENRIPSNGEIIQMIRNAAEDPACAPGEAFAYSDVNYMLLAHAVETLSGVKFEEFMKKRIFEPAGMKDSTICYTRRDGRPSDRFTRNMVLEDGKTEIKSMQENGDGGYYPPPREDELRRETAAGNRRKSKP